MQRPMMSVVAQLSMDTPLVHVHGPGMKKPAVFTPPKFVDSLAFVSEHEVVLGCGDEVLRRYDVRSPDKVLSETPAPEYRRLVQSAEGRRIALSAPTRTSMRTVHGCSTWSRCGSTSRSRARARCSSSRAMA